MSKFANEEEIRYAHSLLLAGKPFFDQQKIDIIECNETKDVKACPGSGKTTTLLAKLAIIANRMPLPNNQGICVLTHTNVAIEEIKSKLGSKASVLFSYPNHFGTIQSFVDKFLANLAMQYYYDSSIRIVDDMLANDMLTSEFMDLVPYNNPLHGKLFGQLIDDYNLFSEEEISYLGDLNKLCSLKVISPKVGKRTKKYRLKMSGYKIADLRTSGLSEQSIKSIYGLRDRVTALLVEPKNEKIRSAHIDYITRKVVFDGSPIDINTPAAQEFIRLKENLFKQGIIKYGEAYDLAMRLCEEYNEIIKGAITSRFRYLFVDEMQDTDEKQIALINKLFSDSIIQCFGDHNQAIYNAVRSNNVWAPTNSLSIDQTVRFGENIAKVLRSVCMEDNRVLVANPTSISLKPVLIIYENTEDVLPKFTSILKNSKIGSESIAEIAQKERETDKLHRNNIKAIGWVGTDRDDVITIKSYFPLFSKDIRRKQKVNYNSLASFLCKKENASINDYSNHIISAILHILSLSPTSKNEVTGKVRKHTKTSFIERFKLYSEETYRNFRVNLVVWSKMIHDGVDTVHIVKEYISRVLPPIFTFDIATPDIKSFLDSAFEEISEEQASAKNIYSLDDVEIEVNTIHSVKGETHAATLYLETYFDKKYESERIHPQLSGVINTDKSEKNISTLKMAYVGMSRPKYLLCMAIHKDRFTFDSESLRELWVIEKCSQ